MSGCPGAIPGSFFALVVQWTEPRPSKPLMRVRFLPGVLENNMAYPRLEQWEFRGHGCLMGTVYGHPTREDGTNIATSPVIARNPETNIVQTKSGTIYQLGEHGGKYWLPKEIWNDEGWIGGGIRTPIPRLKLEESSPDPLPSPDMGPKL